jgi:hypothetical protein
VLRAFVDADVDVDAELLSLLDILLFILYNI